MQKLDIDLTKITKELNLEKLRLEIKEKFPLHTEFQYGEDSAMLWDFDSNYTLEELQDGFDELVKAHDNSPIPKKIKADTDVRIDALQEALDYILMGGAL